jgi:hypothetical protein
MRWSPAVRPMARLGDIFSSLFGYWCCVSGTSVERITNGGRIMRRLYRNFCVGRD